jgi:hypothetical protein
MAELTERIMSELETRNVKSLRQTRQVLESIEKGIIDDIMRNILDMILDYVENADKPTPLEIYVWLKQRREELDSEEEETGEEQEEGEK